jgi:hypothetical protein
LIVGRRHLQRVLGEFVRHYNAHRPHRGLGLSPPQPRADYGQGGALPIERIARHDVLGGLIHEYQAAA